VFPKRQTRPDAQCRTLAKRVVTSRQGITIKAFVSSSTTPPESSQGEDLDLPGERLDSWKSIATYLGREVRTVQRWEKTEYLPVHRHQHAKLGSVYAYTAELKEWQNSRRLSAPKEEEPITTEQAAQVEPVAAPVPSAAPFPWKLALVLAAACCLSGLVVLLILEKRSASTLYNPLPLTTDEGWQSAPSFSPDGSSVVYAWSAMDGEHSDVYTEVIGSSKPVKLTTTPGNAFRPTWSPDGQWIAFLRNMENGHTGLWLHSLPKKTEWRLRELEGDYGPQDRTLAWMPDTKGLIVPEYTSTLQAGGLYYVPLQPGAADVRLTKPPSGQGDSNSAVSPDGRQMIFARFFSSGVSHLCALQLSADHAPLGAERTIDWPGFGMSSSTEPAFWGQSGDLLFLSNRNGSSQIWRSHDLQAPEVIGLPAGKISNLAVSERSQRIVYSLDRSDANIWRIDAGQLRAKRSAEPERVIASTELDQRPQVSPDGTQIAFESNRSGATEIWKFNLKTGESFQVTHLRHMGTGSPAWSPDSKEIAFDSRMEGKADIYKISAFGGIPARLTYDPSTDMLPTWSNDGRWIYFSSSRSGSNQIWRIPASGGGAEQITKGGGLDSRMAIDGSYLYYTQGFGNRAIWRVRPSGGDETQMIELTVLRGFALDREGVFFAAPLQPDREELRYLDLGMKTMQPLFIFRHKLIPPLSSDGRFLYFSQYDSIISNLMIVEHFQ